MKRWFVLLSLILLTACDPMAPQPTPVSVIVTPIPSITPIPLPTSTATPTPTRTPTPEAILQPSATPFPCDDDSGRVEAFTPFRSDVASGENLRFNVYLPPCYIETQARFPVVYLLHGLDYDEEQWRDIGLFDALDQGIRLGALPPMVVVMPYLGQLGQFNNFPPNPSYETYILEELVPAVERQICTRQDREFRAIGGISRGGFWAYSIAFRHPDVFGIVGGHSAFFPQNLRDVPAAFNPLEIARNSSILPAANLRMYMDGGAGDSASPSLQMLSDRLRERQIAHDYVIRTVGEHDNDYWSAHVSEYLAFYGDNWPRDYAGLPSCID
ncbi:MAG: hypothetical protein EA396_01575 [Anaerolineaceae bacterium]|nr:MAG: hypothetical protein EA396_01575 [Anaerolineaceae bacterium]